MKRHLIWLIPLLLVGFLALLVAKAPARLITNWLPQDPQAPLRLEFPTGTVWRGEARLQSDQGKIADLRWQLDVLPLLTAQLSLHLQMQGDLNGQAHLRADRASADLVVPSGTVAESRLRRMADTYEIEVGGDIAIADLHLKLDLPENEAARAQFIAATGTLTWEGGPVTYPMNGQWVTAQLPPLVGQLSLIDNTSMLNVAAAASPTRELMRLSLDGEGWGGAAVTRSFIEMSGVAWPGNETGETYVLEVQEKLF